MPVLAARAPLAVLASLLLLAVACGGEEEHVSTTVASAPGPRVVIATDAGQVTVDVEVADTPAERETGLMDRESLPEDAGMLFEFDGDSTGGFWMKDTLIPLSIAFADADGTILSILDMDPCTADPCRVYDPGVAYRRALEVNRGAFERWGVSEGDRLTLQG
ncbi:MAG TPA: DUF192 domain-containing protein [Gaiellaceae bacterium]|nr:DUF192 domain-containing protein [Gaiellaceae bacterium]